MDRWKDGQTSGVQGTLIMGRPQSQEAESQQALRRKMKKQPGAVASWSP